jgi:putative endopeptidase
VKEISTPLGSIANVTDYDHYGPHGLNLASLKPSVRPQDDLFTFVNGTWLDNVAIPEDRSRYGAFDGLRQLSDERVRGIIEELAAQGGAPGTVAQKVGDLYASFMDEVAIEAKGVSPIADDLAMVAEITDAESLARVLGALELRGHGGFFYQYVDTDARESTRYIVHIGQAGLSLPDESYYREEQHQSLVVALEAHISAMLNLAGVADAGAHAARVIALETAIAGHHWDSVRDRDAELTYNKFTFAELTAQTPNLHWNTWMVASETPDAVMAEVIVRQPSFFSGLSDVLGDFDAASWQSWLTYHIVSGAAPYLPKAFVDQNFAFYGTTLSGTPTIRDRWKRGVSVVEGGLGEAVGELFVERYFPPAAKAKMRDLVDHLVEAYRVEIDALAWMSSETKAKAQIKLQKFTPKIGYPDAWRDYSSLTITRDDLMANVRAISAFARAYSMAKIGKPIDRNEWFMFPQTVNAYYNPGMNEIVFPAAILQPPFFNLEGDDAYNYGAIGGVIGHEIGHGFDDQGSKFDGDGNLVNWWTDEDRAAFEALADVLIKQYDELSPDGVPDVKLNGALTIGENIGDLGGLAIALKAYELSLEGREAPIVDDFTGVQRVFIGWAQVWRTKARPEEARRLAAIDPHSPAEARCNQIVRNLREFYEAFDVTEGDAMYLAPDARVRIW